MRHTASPEEIPLLVENRVPLTLHKLTPLLHHPENSSCLDSYFNAPLGRKRKRGGGGGREPTNGETRQKRGRLPSCFSVCGRCLKRGERLATCRRTRRQSLKETKCPVPPLLGQALTL